MSNFKIQRSFASKATSKALKEAPTIQTAKKDQQIDQKNELTVDLKRMKFTKDTPNLFEFLQQKGNLESLVDMEYKKYPLHISHNNPSSVDYIESEIVDAQLRAHIQSHNEIIDRIKNNIKLNERYQEAIQKIEKTSDSHMEPGNTRNVYEKVKDYSIPVENSPENEIESCNELLSLLDNEKVLLNAIPYQMKLPKAKIMTELEKEIENRPVNPHFNTTKGHKYDVEVPHSDRVKHVADRLGHPEIFPTPIETLLRLERPLCHPGFLDQPFIQIPSEKPDSILDFSLGEVVYENPNIKDWNKFWIYNYFLSTTYAFAWYPFLILAKSTTVPSFISEDLPSASSEWNYLEFDTYQFHPFFYLAGITVFHMVNLKLINNMTRPFVAKIQYNATKELIFVTKVGRYGETYVEAHEVAHIEWVPPYAKVVTQFMNFTKSGITTLTDLCKREEFYVINDDAYWNPKLKKEFIDGFSTLWDASYYQEGVGKHDVGKNVL